MSESEKDKSPDPPKVVGPYFLAGQELKLSKPPEIVEKFIAGQKSQVLKAIANGLGIPASICKPPPISTGKVCSSISCMGGDPLGPIRRSIDARIRWQLAVEMTELSLPDWVTQNRRRLAELLYLAGECFEYSLCAIAVHHRMKIRP